MGEEGVDPLHGLCISLCFAASKLIVALATPTQQKKTRPQRPSPQHTLQAGAFESLRFRFRNGPHFLFSPL